MTSPMDKAWAVSGIDLPEAFVFPITKLGITTDVHGGGPFVNTPPTRVDCHVHIEDSLRLQILSAPLSPETGAELEVAHEFELQFSLALWLYRSLPCGIVTWQSRRPLAAQRPTTTMVTIPRATTPVPWSLRGEALEGFLRFSRALLEFHEDRQAYLVARYIPDVLTDDDIKVFFVSGHPVDAKWLDAHWPVMAATDLYERARMANDADIGFLLLMMSLEVLFNDPDVGPEVSRRLAQRCAFLNGRDSSERISLFEGLTRLYKRRNRLVHGNLLDKTRFLELPNADTLRATNVVRLSLLRLIALSRAKKEVMTSLDRAIFDSNESDRLHTEVKSYWEKRGVDIASIFDARVGLEAR